MTVKNPDRGSDADPTGISDLPDCQFPLKIPLQKCQTVPQGRRKILLCRSKQAIRQKQKKRIGYFAEQGFRSRCFLVQDRKNLLTVPNRAREIRNGKAVHAVQTKSPAEGLQCRSGKKQDELVILPFPLMGKTGITIRQHQCGMSRREQLFSLLKTIVQRPGKQKFDSEIRIIVMGAGVWRRTDDVYSVWSIYRQSAQS